MKTRSRMFNILLLVLITSMLVLSPRFYRSARAQDRSPGGTSAMSPLLGGEPAGLQQIPGASRLAYHTGTGLVRFVGTEPGQVIPQPVALPPGSTPETAARNFLGVYGEQFGLKQPDQELRLRNVESAEGDRAFVRFQQVHQGIPVLGGELIVQLDAKQNVLSVGGELLPDLDLSLQPRVDAELARKIAIETVAKTYTVPVEAVEASQAELWIYNPLILGAPGLQQSRLVWRLQVTPLDLRPIRELVLVDASRGSVALHFNQVDSALSRAIYNNNNNYTIGLPGTSPARTEGQPPTGVADVDRAYEYSGNTYNFYSTYHGRDSLDGLGMTLISTVNYCPDALNCPYQNAFWNGVQMVYGQGFAAADDVVAHELTHGVTENESNLFYYMQSGAINESFSDIWGEFVDLSYDGAYDNDDPSVRWLMGEDIPGIGAIRSMSNPPAFGDPDKMSSGYYVCSSADNGGVHTNSGVGNKAAYLMADGGSFNGFTITGIGITKTARIFYEAQAHMLTSAADYLDLAESLSQACNNLVGTYGISTSDCTQVRKAIAAVEMTRQPVSCPANEAPACDIYGFNSQFNGVFTGWHATSGTWTSSGSYASTSGVVNNFTILASDASYGDFEYRAYMRRLGCNTCANGLLIRGTPSPLQDYSRWNTDYAFLYTRNGSVSVWKRIGAVEMELMPWTTSEAVNTGDSWNTLRVIAQDNRFFFYINDKLVWSGKEGGYSFGQVGIAMFRDSASTGNMLDVDWAILAGGTPLTLFKDSFEHGLEFWSHAATTGSDEWYHEYGYASTGQYMLYGYDQPSVSDMSARLKNAVNLPAGQNAYVHFRHAYDFEASFDGGVVEYSTNGGGSWSDAGSLAVNNGYNGTLSGSFGNPLGGRNAFTGMSSGYTATRLNLSSLAGNPVLLRFRIGTDNSVSDLGWLIDDVHVYTCMNRVQPLYLPMLTRDPQASGFDSQFTDSSNGWHSISGAWRVNGGVVASDGIPGASASMSNWQTFANLDFTVRMHRQGCNTCANRVIVRGAPFPLAQYRSWSEPDLFQYSNDRYYSVYRRIGGISIPLQVWTSTAAINQGGYNTLRVVANGANFNFYINGTLVWSGSDTSLERGLVGFGMYRNDYSEDNLLSVHYATLTGGTTAAQQMQVSPEQPALNDAPLSGGSVDMSP